MKREKTAPNHRGKNNNVATFVTALAAIATELAQRLNQTTTTGVTINVYNRKGVVNTELFLHINGEVHHYTDLINQSDDIKLLLAKHNHS